MGILAIIKKKALSLLSEKVGTYDEVVMEYFIDFIDNYRNSNISGNQYLLSKLKDIIVLLIFISITNSNKKINDIEDLFN